MIHLPVQFGLEATHSLRGGKVFCFCEAQAVVPILLLRDVLRVSPSQMSL